MKSMGPSLNLNSTLTRSYSMLVYKSLWMRETGQDANFPFQGLTLVSTEAPITLEFDPALLNSSSDASVEGSPVSKLPDMEYLTGKVLMIAQRKQVI